MLVEPDGYFVRHTYFQALHSRDMRHFEPQTFRLDADQL